MTTLTPQQVAALIVRRDRAFKPVVDAVGPPKLRRRPAPVDERFSALVSSITSQLLATSAAATIHARVVEACGGRVSVASILEAGPDVLRAVGLNRTKAEAMVALAYDVDEGRVRLSRHGRMSDHDVVADVSSVRGIGPWTAHMYLIFTLGRPDVWPVGDYGVRAGWTSLHRLDEIVTEKQLRDLGDPFDGVRTAAAWYCWQALHLARASK